PGHPSTLDSDDKDFLVQGQARPALQVMRQSAGGMGLHSTGRGIQKLCSQSPRPRNHEATGAEGGACTMFALRGFASLAGRAVRRGAGGRLGRARGRQGKEARAAALVVDLLPAGPALARVRFPRGETRR
ncbi:hypothetical protein THAOC_10177, partial [Thalassiosira oceanica]